LTNPTFQQLLEQFVVIQDSIDGDKIFQDDYGDKLWFKTCNENKLNMGSIICPSHGIMLKIGFFEILWLKLVKRRRGMLKT
jgi:hypothetical protein